jgi:hypothetical protein
MSASIARRNSLPGGLAKKLASSGGTHRPGSIHTGENSNVDGGGDCLASGDGIVSGDGTLSGDGSVSGDGIAAGDGVGGGDGV